MQDRGIQWFDYITKFIEQCIQTDTDKFSNFNDKCADEILNQFNVSISYISQCIDRSFVKKGDFNSDNFVFHIDNKKRDLVGVSMRP